MEGLLGRSSCKRDDNVKVDVKETSCEHVILMKPMSESISQSISEIQLKIALPHMP
jgi:hypothetical protein